MHSLKILKSITNRNEESLHRYLNDIGKIEMIDYREEIRLAQMIREGNKDAENRLVIANLRFVISCAKKYQNKGLSMQDLINEGNIGLIRAAKKFDETRGFKFISYAVWWIRQAILEALFENANMIRVPMNQQVGIRGVNKEREKLEQILERDPTLRELAESLKKKEGQISDHLDLNLNVRSYDDLISSREAKTGTFLDFMVNEEENPVDNGIEEEFRTSQIRLMFDRVLTEREQKIICMAFGLFGYPLKSNQDIADDLKLTRERVRQLVKYSLGKLKKMAKHSYFQHYGRVLD